MVIIKKIGRVLKRIFQNIGVFEVMAGLLLVAALLVVMIMTRSKKEWVEAEIKLASPAWWQKYYVSPPYWMGESIQTGDKEFDAQGKVIAEVKKIKIYEISDETEEATVRKDFYLTLSLQVTKDKRTGKMKYKHKPLEIGGPIDLHLDNTLVNGLAVYLQGAPDQQEMKEIIIRGVWMNLFPWQAEAIPVGGKMYDGAGRVIAEILDKKVTASNMVVTTDQGEVVARKHPTRKDVELRIKLLVKKQGENLYFREDQKVKIGDNLFFHFPEINVNWVNVAEIFDTQGNPYFQDNEE